jgi:hypothetical protein
MCDNSLQNVASRPARVGDRLTTRNFGTGTREFAASEDVGVVVRVLPGTELAFENPVKFGAAFGLLRQFWKTHDYRTAIFRQINKERAAAHHDALEFPDGRTSLLTGLKDRRRWCFNCQHGARMRRNWRPVDASLTLAEGFSSHDCQRTTPRRRSTRTAWGSISGARTGERGRPKYR